MISHTNNKNMLKTLIFAIHTHPKFSGILGSVIAFIFSLIDIPRTTQYIELIGAIIKTIGIIAGASIAVASAYIYFRKLLKKNNP